MTTQTPTLMTTPFRFFLTLLLALFVGGGLAGCDLFEVDDFEDPNGASLDDVLANPTRAAIGNLAVGVEASSRIDLDLYLVDVGVIGREYWRTSAADPRLTADLLGRGTSVLDNNTFYITRPWGARYRTIRNANTLLQAIDLNGQGTVSEDEQFSDAEAAAARGYADFWLAYQYLLNLNLTYQNGIRFIEPGSFDPGPVVGYDAALERIAGLLAEAADELATADELGGEDATFPFPMSPGFTGFSTPSPFRQAVQGLAARVAAYRGRFDEVESLLDESFVDEDAELDRGVAHVFSIAAGDLINPFFVPPTNAVGDAILAHPSYADDIAEDDDRINDVVDRGEASTFDGLTSQFGFFRYKSIVDAIPIVRNGELLLLRAEANIQNGGFGDAVEDLNVIRNAAGLGNYDGEEDEGSLVDEMLRQRRFELYGEGHRWIDVRRYNNEDCDFSQLDGGGCLNDDLPIDRPERTDDEENVIEADDVWLQFPIPASENV